MASHKALLLLEKQGAFVVQDVPTPKPGPGELLIEVKAAGLNPVDWKVNYEYIFLLKGFPAILGSDAAGIVKEVGEGVTGFTVGDRVLHHGYFTNPQGTFQQYAIVPSRFAAQLPSSLPFEQAATIPLAFATAAFGLYSGRIATGELRGAELTPPWQEGGRGKYAGQPIVIIGGASSVGQQAIQLAKLSGFSPVITTASPKHTEFLNSLGATHVVDRDADLNASVKTITAEPVKYVFDAISLKETAKHAYDVLAPGGTLTVVLLGAADELDANSNKRVAQVVGTVHDPTQKEVAVGLYQNLTKLLESGDIKPNNVEVLPNGLAGIPDGLKRLQEGRVSASKLVALPWA